jgi:uridine kinase
VIASGHRQIVDRIASLESRQNPLLVAIDGRSGAGKSTLADAVAAELDAAVIRGDDFNAGRSSAEWDAMSP